MEFQRYVHVASKFPWRSGAPSSSRAWGMVKTALLGLATSNRTLESVLQSSWRKICFAMKYFYDDDGLALVTSNRTPVYRLSLAIKHSSVSSYSLLSK